MDDAQYRLVVEDSPEPADLALLEERVAAAARRRSRRRRRARSSGSSSATTSGRILAGISGMVWGECCELHAMWVDESLRGRGLARALMNGAEG